MYLATATLKRTVVVAFTERKMHIMSTTAQLFDTPLTSCNS